MASSDDLKLGHFEGPRLAERWHLHLKGVIHQPHINPIVGFHSTPRSHAEDQAPFPDGPVAGWLGTPHILQGKGQWPVGRSKHRDVRKIMGTTISDKVRTVSVFKAQFCHVL